MISYESHSNKVSFLTIPDGPRGAWRNTVIKISERFAAAVDVEYPILNSCWINSLLPMFSCFEEGRHTLVIEARTVVQNWVELFSIGGNHQA